MRLPEFGVKYPVTTTMIFTSAVLLGLFASVQLGIDLMPNIEMPVIGVITTYPGAGPEEIETRVTEVLEEQLSTIGSLDRLESISEEGASVITMKFGWGVDLDGVSNDVRDRISLAEQYLPDDINKPIVFKFDFSMMPIVIFGITASQSYPGLYDLIDEKICDPLKTVPGVAAAIIRGGLERQVLVELDRASLEAYNVSIDRVLQALRAENISIPGGHIKAGQKDYLIRIPEEIKVNEIGGIVVGATPQGKPIYIRDVATVKDSFKELTRFVEIEKNPGLLLFIQKQSGTNTVKVTRRVMRKLEELKKNLPPDVRIKVIRNFSDFIVQSLKGLRGALITGGILVVLILLFSLRNIMAGLITAISIPTSLIVAFLLLYMGGYTLNIISVSSLAIALGMVVDASIVVIDNIHRYRQAGNNPFKSAIDGTQEMALAIMASTLTTVVIFVPLVFIGGITGIMFKEMAFVITLTLLASLVTALILTPMLSSRFMDKWRLNPKRIFNISERLFEVLDDRYKQLLVWALGHRKNVILGALGIFIFSLLLVPLVGSKFMPEEDSNIFTASVELPIGTRVEETGRVMRAIEDIIMREVPERMIVSCRWGYGEDSGGRMVRGDEGSNTGWIGSPLVSKVKRRRSVWEIVDRLRYLTKNFPGAKIRFSTEDPLQGILFGMGSPLVLEVYGYDMEEGMRLVQDIVQEMSKVKGVVDIEISRKMGKPELQVVVDRDKASRLGINVSEIGNTIQTLFSGKTATKYREKGKEYDIFVRLKEEDRFRIDDLRNSFVVSRTGKKIRLSNIARIIEETGPVKIERKNQERVIKIMANLSGRDLGSAVKEISRRLKNVRIPDGFHIEFGGERKEQVEAFGLMRIAMLLGVILVYMVMASQFESFRDPFIILFSIPFAFTGVIWGLFLTRQMFTLTTFIALIMLVGIVVNNAIVLISYINILRSRGMDIYTAVTEGGRHRLRPVLMTTVTTLLGLLPLALSRGEGSESWRPFGITMIGGLSVSTLVTLVLIPTLYFIFEGRGEGCS